MRYQVQIGDDELLLELTSTEPGVYRARLGQRELEVTVLSDRPTLAVAIEGQVIELGKREPAARVVDPKQARRTRQGQSQGAGASTIKAPMPGRIVKVAVSVGQTVTAGDPALVIEAMKMENELLCPQSGSVQRVLVKPGDTVERGATLVEIG